MGAPSPAADPVFVGGAGRSGLQAVARLLGAHSRYHSIDAPVRFHVDEGGLPDLLEGRVELERFLERLRGHWWYHSRTEETESGLHQLVSRGHFERAVGDFERSFPDDPVGASRELVRSLLDPLGSRAGAPSWVEWSPRAVAAGPTLARLFPDCKVVHVLRDGRDVACSMVSLPWGPDSIVRAVAGWERQLRAADAGATELPADRLLSLNIADLAIDEREPTYDRLLEFLGLDDESGIREHFENKLLPGGANPGRWEIDLSDSEQHELARAYERALGDLTRDGVASAEDLARRAGFDGSRSGRAAPKDRLSGLPRR